MRKGIAAVSVIAVVAILMLAGGVVLYQRFSTPKATPSPSPQVSETAPTPILSSPGPINETANWKTFSGSGFQIQYPPDVTVQTESDGYVSLSKWGPTQKADTEFYDGLSLRIKVDNLGSSDLKGIAEAALKESKEVADITKPLTKTEFYGREAYTYTARGLGDNKYTFAAEGNKVIRVADSTLDPENQGFDSTVDKILSTFKLTN